MKLDTAVFSSPSLPPRFPQKCRFGRGFTLIELSIVLVVIGLLVGGVLVGRDLIKASETRAEITQIDKYNQAVNIFKGKYSYLPGDIKDPEATQFGFAARGQYAGEGDGNGLIEGNLCNCGTGIIYGVVPQGEPAVAWADLSTARLIDGNFSTASSTSMPQAAPIAAYIPAAKIGVGHIYIYSETGSNFFGLSTVTLLNGGESYYSSPQLSVAQAKAIDIKLDDGLPQTGNVLAKYVNKTLSFGSSVFAAGGGAAGTTGTGATANLSTTCYDNNNVAGATQQYSITQNNGAGVNCALSFRFQ